MVYPLGCFLVLLATLCTYHCAAGYQIGVGRADCTGPPVEIPFMGYGQQSQVGEGIHLRQFSRAFIVDDGLKRIVFVSVDAATVGDAVKRAVLQRLTQDYGSTYTYENVIISGTNTHSTPGGFLTYLLYDLPCLGFAKETFNALVVGITKSITRAHNSMTSGSLFISETEILDVNINRSPAAYLNNPAEERSQYEYDVDKILTQVRFVASSGKVMGAINWYPIHLTSMNNTNKLISSDNMGYAAILLEQEYNPDSLVGQGDFVGAFASANLGDVSPNIMGPKCQNTGEPCDILTSACPITAGLCVASGPGKDIFESTKIIGQRIYEGASSLLSQQPEQEITGTVGYIHQFVKMPEMKVNYTNPATGVVVEGQGCYSAMGYSFAAGTTDGPGTFGFEQGVETDNPLWNIVREFVVVPPLSDVNCHYPKPILLSTGRIALPYDWQPQIIPTQIIKIGNALITALPGEFTTMSGRRLRNAVRRAANDLLKSPKNDTIVILSGLSNIHSSYVTTPEEYQIQRYEGASTIFGPYTLPIYIDQYLKLSTALLNNEAVPPGPEPPHLEDEILLSLQTGLVYDSHPIGQNFGTVKTQPKASYGPGETVSVVFVAGNPRNNLMYDDTYLRVEQYNQVDNKWSVVATDANWETRFKWERTSTLLGTSEATVLWEVGQDTPPGTYRINHSGYYQDILSNTYPYSGTSRTFIVGQ